MSDPCCSTYTASPFTSIQRRSEASAGEPCASKGQSVVGNVGAADAAQNPGARHAEHGTSALGAGRKARSVPAIAACRSRMIVP